MTSREDVNAILHTAKIGDFVEMWWDCTTTIVAKIEWLTGNRTTSSIIRDMRLSDANKLSKVLRIDAFSNVDVPFEYKCFCGPVAWCVDDKLIPNTTPTNEHVPIFHSTASDSKGFYINPFNVAFMPIERAVTLVLAGAFDI